MLLGYNGSLTNVTGIVRSAPMASTIIDIQRHVDVRPAMDTREQRWTDETEQCVIASLDESLGEANRDRARDILAALAAAGVLVEPGGETREEWAYRSHWRDGTDHDMWCTSEETARFMAAQPVSNPVTVRSRSLIHRTIYVGPAEAAQ